MTVLQLYRCRSVPIIHTQWYHKLRTLQLRSYQLRARYIVLPHTHQLGRRVRGRDRPERDMRRKVNTLQ